MHPEIKISINTVIDFIEINLSKQLTLEELASIANLSKFHFHRTFKIITRETPNEYIIRKRIEKIASILICNKDSSISDLSIQFGFKDLSSFSRSFKKFYGISATQLKKANETGTKLKEVQNSKICKPNYIFQNYFCDTEETLEWMKNKGEITVLNVPKVDVAYIRHWGNPNTILKTLQKLPLERIENKNELNNILYIIFHDNPSLTVDYKNQQSACIEINNLEIKTDNLSFLTIPSRKYVLGKFKLSNNEFDMAWKSMVLWMNQNNVRSNDGYRFERFSKNSLLQKSSVFELEIAIPTK